MTNKPMLSVEPIKLVAILASELNEWPEGCDELFQTSSGRAIGISSADDEVSEKIGQFTMNSEGNDPHVTRAEFESAKAELTQKPAAQHQGEPVAWYKPHWNGLSAEFCLGAQLVDSVFPEMWRKLYAEQPAPVAVDDCENHKTISAAYREILKALGGEDMDFSEALIKAGEAVMPKGSPIAVVMPGRMKPEDNPEHPAREWVAEIYNSALDAVARLNGVKP